MALYGLRACITDSLGFNVPVFFKETHFHNFFHFLYFRVEKEKGQLIIEIDNLQGINEALSKGKVSTVLSTLLSQLLSKMDSYAPRFKENL